MSHVGIKPHARRRRSQMFFRRPFSTFQQTSASGGQASFAILDTDGNPILDTDGRFITDTDGVTTTP